jgi:hypothetical protein
MIHGDRRLACECAPSPLKRAASIMRWALLGMVVLTSPVRAGDFDSRLRASPSSLARNAADQQFVQQQAQIARTLARVEESRRLNAQSHVRLASPPRLDLAAPRKGVGHAAHAQRYAQDLDQFSDRLRALEAQRRTLGEALTARRMQQTQDD